MVLGMLVTFIQQTLKYTLISPVLCQVPWKILMQVRMPFS